MAAAALLLAILVMPALADNGTHLSSASVSPRGGTTSTTVVIEVEYRNSHDSAASWVTASVDGVKHPMASEPGGDPAHGVTFRWSGRLPAGHYPVVITAHAKNGGDDHLNAGWVTILALPGPSPTPGPTPNPTSPPTPKPSAKPSTAPTPTPRPEPKATPKPTPRVTPRATTPPATNAATPSPAAASTAIAEPSSAPTLSPTPSATPSPSPSAEPTPSPSSEPPIVAAAVGGIGPDAAGSTGAPPESTAGGSGPAAGPAAHGGPLVSLLAIVGLKAPVFPGMPLGPTLVTTTGGVATAMAFGLFGRRRRDDERSDDVLRAGAASGIGVVPLELARAAGAAPAPSMVDGVPVASVDDEGAPAVETEDLEAGMPRWRRPSLILARKADPVRDNPEATHLTFDHGLVGPLDGRERRVIRYRVVRLLDTPDELRGVEIGFVDQGDEVQLLEKYGAYWQVLCPDGQQGWLHKMTLGDVVDADRPTGGGPVATMPIHADSWTMGGADVADVDGDVLDAYLASRRRRDA